MTPEPTDNNADDNDGGIGIETLLCFNDHGKSGQVMEHNENGGYTCPECGRRGGYRLQWEDP